MLTSLADHRHSFEFNEEVDASVDEAKAWVAAGVAEYVTSEPVDTPERRVRRPETRR
jgi:hypothetical protein